MKPILPPFICFSSGSRPRNTPCSMQMPFGYLKTLPMPSMDLLFFKLNIPVSSDELHEI